MNRPSILIADNRSEFAGQARQYLERNGYSVVETATVESARETLQSGTADLAVIDVRMSNDDDPDDWSGIEVARDTAPEIPKIVLTAYPTVRAVREALSPALRKVPPAVDFLSKQQGLPALLAAVRGALDPDAVCRRGRLLAAMDSPNTLALSEAPARFGSEESINRVRRLLESDRSELSVPREAARKRAHQLNHYANIAAWIAIALIVVALCLLAMGRLTGSVASLLATLAISAVKQLFDGRAREAQRSADQGAERVARLNWIHEMIEITTQMDPKSRERSLERILEFMLTGSRNL